MARIIVVTSGKGGVGKTTSSAAISTGLAQRGKKTVVIDFDIGLRNLDLIMGCERRVVYDFVESVSVARLVLWLFGICARNVGWIFSDSVAGHAPAC